MFPGQESAQQFTGCARAGPAVGSRIYAATSGVEQLVEPDEGGEASAIVIPVQRIEILSLAVAFIDHNRFWSSEALSPAHHREVNGNEHDGSRDSAAALRFAGG